MRPVSSPVKSDVAPLGSVYREPRTSRLGNEDFRNFTTVPYTSHHGNSEVLRSLPLSRQYDGVNTTGTWHSKERGMYKENQNSRLAYEMLGDQTIERFYDPSYHGIRYKRDNDKMRRDNHNLGSDYGYFTGENRHPTRHAYPDNGFSEGQGHQEHDYHSNHQNLGNHVHSNHDYDHHYSDHLQDNRDYVKGFCDKNSYDDGNQYKNIDQVHDGYDLNKDSAHNRNHDYNFNRDFDHNPGNHDFHFEHVYVNRDYDIEHSRREYGYDRNRDLKYFPNRHHDYNDEQSSENNARGVDVAGHKQGQVNYGFDDYSIINGNLLLPRDGAHSLQDMNDTYI